MKISISIKFDSHVDISSLPGYSTNLGYVLKQSLVSQALQDFENNRKNFHLTNELGDYNIKFEISIDVSSTEYMTLFDNHFDKNSEKLNIALSQEAKLELATYLTNNWFIKTPAHILEGHYIKIDFTKPDFSKISSNVLASLISKQESLDNNKLQIKFN